MKISPFVLLFSLPCLAPAQEANTWQKVDAAVIHGRRTEMPMVYASDMKKFLVVGGRTGFSEYRKVPRSYDEIALDLSKGQWENLFPSDKNWGPKFGECKVPGWKGENWEFNDSEGNVRPNWTVYGTFSLGRQYDYDSDAKNVVFYANGKTFSYDPAKRTWRDLKPATDPQKELGGVLLWSSMCHDRHNKQFVLFGGGNVQTERGDPGMWTYAPAGNTWTQLKLDMLPPQRANSPMVYDPVAKKIVLFGGDQLDQLLADTWTFDVVTQKWEERKPARGPSPRAGHALLWVPKAKKILLLGGYEYTSATGYVESLYRPLPMDAWVYDLSANTWELLTRMESIKTGPVGPRNMGLSAAVNEDDLVVVAANGTWKCQVDVTRLDPAGAKFAVKSGTVARRTGPHDPAWLTEGVPAAEPAKVAEELKSLPANQWLARPTPKLPRPNMDWGSAVFAPELDLIMRFSGGHSAYSGTAPQVYNVKTDRYTIPFTPEYPLEFVYSNDQVRGEWSFKKNPWMTGHTYKATGYDPHLKSLVFAAHEYTYFFDPKQGKWSRNSEVNPFRPNMYVVTLCPTPKGVVAWADKRSGGGAGLWRLDADTRTWKPLPLSGPLPATSPDRHGMAYDSKRDRLLLLSDVDKNKGDILQYDFKTGQSKWLNAAGKEKSAVPARETVYLPEADMVMVGAHVAGPDKQRLWPLYDCGKNAWFGAELPGADPVGKGTFKNSFNNSMGLMVDPNRHLVWAVGQNSHVHVLRFDRKSAKLILLQ